MEFELWLETENVESEIDDFCNVLVTLATGDRYALNVWTFAFFEVARGEDRQIATPGLTKSYMFPPDLFVADLSRTTLEPIVIELLEKGLMPAHCLVSDED